MKSQTNCSWTIQTHLQSKFLQCLQRLTQRKVFRRKTQRKIQPQIWQQNSDWHRKHFVRIFLNLISSLTTTEQAPLYDEFDDFNKDTPLAERIARRRALGSPSTSGENSTTKRTEKQAKLGPSSLYLPPSDKEEEDQNGKNEEPTTATAETRPSAEEDLDEEIRRTEKGSCKSVFHAAPTMRS